MAILDVQKAMDGELPGELGPQGFLASQPTDGRSLRVVDLVTGIRESAGN